MAPERSVAGDHQSRGEAEGVGHVLDPGPFEFLPFDEGGVGGHCPLGLGPAEGGDDEPYEADRLLRAKRRDPRNGASRRGYSDADGREPDGVGESVRVAPARRIRGKRA